jgi:hypothetical protein
MIDFYFLWPMDGSECGPDRPGFGGDAVSRKPRFKNLNIIVQVLDWFSKETVHKQPLFPKFLDKPRFELWHSQRCNELSTELPAGIAVMVANAPLEPPLN